MATRKATATAEIIDLKEFKRQREIVVRQAAEGIAERIAKIEVILAEIADLKEISGVPVDLENVYYRVKNIDVTNGYGWYNSNC